jgi:hypothetical protein
MSSSSEAQLKRVLKEFMEYLNDNHALVWFSADYSVRHAMTFK